MDQCPQGHDFVQNFDRILGLFRHYTADITDMADIETYMPEYCRQGFACLPCEPGHVEVERSCVPCDYGSYNPNVGSTTCYLCNYGQNTTQKGSVTNTSCVCDPGFE